MNGTQPLAELKLRAIRTMNGTQPVAELKLRAAGP
jgi:hypothetical protein